MLNITVPAWEGYDPIHNLFVETEEQMLTLEHSLVSVSKWESKWLKPFLSKTARTQEESVDYIRCMTLNCDINPEIYYALTPSLIKQIVNYIDAPMTATTISHTQKHRGSPQILTNETIYYLMIFYGIPFECQHWHLNRLLTLIGVCEAKGAKPQKIPLAEQAAMNRRLNAARRKAWNTRG